MQRFILTMALAVAPIMALADLATPSGRVLITIAGEIVHTNRGPLEAGSASMMGHQDIGFEVAAEFDQIMLDALPQTAFEALDPLGQRTVRYSGPPLTAILSHVGGGGKSVSVVAADGYLVDLKADDIATYAPILATRINGRLMGLGEHGPAMIAFPPTGDAEIDAEHTAKQPWAVMYLGVK